MSKPIRIQRKRTKGWKMPENTVYVGRPTIYGNPYKPGDQHPFSPDEKMTVEDCVDLYRYELRAAYVLGAPESIQKLKDKNLACWCPLDQPCHADVLLELANGE